MNSRWLLYVALPVLALAASNGVAGEPPSVPQPMKKVPGKPAPLNLSIGDISQYVDGAELATPLRDELEEIIVNGKRPEPLPEHRAIPHSMLGALIYAGMHPLDAWRILVPDPYFEIPERSEDDVKEPAGAFRGKILEPGAIYD
jgi:hypothetical protein